MELAEAEYIVTALAAAHLQLGHAEHARTLLASIPPDKAHLMYRLPLQQLRALAEHDFEAAKPGVE
jgi:thioredoxin-like negative regulator of GroEL